MPSTVDAGEVPLMLNAVGVCIGSTDHPSAYEDESSDDSDTGDEGEVVQ